MRKNATTLRVLIVDDEPLILCCLSRFLEKSAVVKTVATAEEAIDEIREQHYDLCFLDITMQGMMTGLDAMKIIKELSPNTKVVIMTGALLDEAMKEQVEDFAYTFIEKPFSLSDIEEVADRVAVTLN